MNTGKVWSPAGLVDGPKNSLVGKGESLIDYTKGLAAIVNKGTVGKDTLPSLAQEGDDIVITGNDKDYLGALTGAYTGNKILSFALQALPYSLQLESLTNIENKMQNKNYGKNSSLAKITAQVQLRELQKAKQAPLQALKEITDRQEVLHNMENNNSILPQYDKGKRSSSREIKVEYGSTRIPWWLRMIPAVAGIGNSIALGLWWRKLDLHRPDIYAKNPYEARALNTMAGLRADTVPAINALNDQVRKAAFSNELAGGLSGALKYLGRLALGAEAARNAANVYAAADELNKKYKTAYAEMAGKLGDSAAQRRLAANQYNDNAFAQAHGRKVKGIETAMYNLQNQLGDWYKNEFKYRTWRDAMRLYIQDQELERDRLDAAREAAMGDRGNNTSSTTNVSVNVPTYNSTINPGLQYRFGPKYPRITWNTPEYKYPGSGALWNEYGGSRPWYLPDSWGDSGTGYSSQLYGTTVTPTAPYAGYNYNTVVNDNTPVPILGNTSTAWQTEDPIYGDRYATYRTTRGRNIDIWNQNDRDRYNYYRNNWPVMIGPDGRDMSSYMPFDSSVVREYGGKKYPYIDHINLSWKGWDNNGFDGTTATWDKLLFDVDFSNIGPTNNSAWKYIGGWPYYRSAVPTLADYYTNYTNRLFNRR